MFGYGMGVASRSVKLADLRRWLSEAAGAPSDGDRWTWGGVGVILDPLDDAANFELVSEMLNQPPLADVWFHLDNKVDDEVFEAAQRHMLVTAVRLAVELDLEAVLAFQGEAVMMRRRRGTVLLYAEWTQWSDPAVIGRLGVPFVTTHEREVF